MHNLDSGRPANESWLTYDHTVKEASEAWHDACLSLTQSGDIDACYVDGCTKVPGSIAPDKEQAYGPAKMAMLVGLQKKVPGPLVCGSNGAVYPGMAGSQIQNWGKSKKYSEREIPMLQKAVAAGALFEAHGSAVCHAKGDPHSADVQTELAAFLVAAGQYSYYMCSSWSGTLPVWYPVYDMKIGAPLGAATLGADKVWRRRFLHVNVSYDTVAERGTIGWGGSVERSAPPALKNDDQEGRPLHAQVSPPGYTCWSGTDISTKCELQRVAKGTPTALALECNASFAQGCRGFNTNGLLKKCVRASCGATIGGKQHKGLVTCFLTDTPTDQSSPAGCGQHPIPPPAPPKPPTPPRPGPGFNCSVTAARSDCQCAGVHPPFGAPTSMPAVQLDGHFPALQPQQAAALVIPTLLSLSSHGAVLQDPSTNQRRTLTVGGVSAWGWELSHSGSSDSGTAVLEYKNDDWAAMVWVAVKNGVVRSVRKPVGRLNNIKQPLYVFEDPQFNCKQDIDPTDWLGNMAANLSESEEPSIASAIRLMAPNPDSGLLGNPEESNKFLLVEGSALHSTPWVADKHAKNGSNCSNVKGGDVLWSLSDYLPAGCTLNGRGEFENVRTGMIGGHLRAVSQGLWSAGNSSSSTTTSGCGAEILAVSPPYDPSARATSTALIKLTVEVNTVSNTSYFKAIVDQHCSELISLEHSTAGPSVRMTLGMSF